MASLSFLASFDKDHRGRCAHNGRQRYQRREVHRRGSMGYQVPNVIRFIRPAEYGAGIPTYIRAPGSWLKHVMRNSALGIGPRRGNRNAMEFVRITTRSALHVPTPGEDFNRDVIVPFLPRNLSRSSRRCGEDRAGN